MTVRKIFIRFYKNIESFVMKSINLFVLSRVEFSKIGIRDVTFSREMRVEYLFSFHRTIVFLSAHYTSAYGQKMNDHFHAAKRKP